MGFRFGPGCCCEKCIRIDETEWTSVPIHTSTPGSLPASTWIMDYFSAFSIAGGELLVSTPDTYAWIFSKKTHPPDGHLNYKYARITGKIRGDHGDGIFIPLAGKREGFGTRTCIIFPGDAAGEGGFIRMCENPAAGCCDGKFNDDVEPDLRDMVIPPAWGVMKDVYFTFEVIATNDAGELGNLNTWVKINGNYVEPMTGNVYLPGYNLMMTGATGSGDGIRLDTVFQANDIRYDDIKYQVLGLPTDNEFIDPEDYECPDPTPGDPCCESGGDPAGSELLFDFGAGTLVDSVATWCDTIAGVIAMEPEAGGPQSFCELTDIDDEMHYYHQLADTDCPEGANRELIRARLHAIVTRNGFTDICCRYTISIALETWQCPTADPDCSEAAGGDDSRDCNTWRWVTYNEGDGGTAQIYIYPWLQTSVDLKPWSFNAATLPMSCCYQPPIGLPTPIPVLCTGTPGVISVSW